MLKNKTFKMKRSPFYILFLILLFLEKGFAQPSWYSGTLLFNLSEEPYTKTKKDITIDDFKNKTIHLLSPDEKTATLKYDTINKAFSFTTKIGYELKTFAVVHKTDTIYIDFPAVPRYNTHICIKSPIPLKGKSFSFYDRKIYDAMIVNYEYNKTDIFYLCRSWQSFSSYEMEEERKEQLKKNAHSWHVIEFKEE